MIPAISVNTNVGATVEAKPAVTFVATAIPLPDGRYLAQYAAPGLVPSYVTVGNPPVPKVFQESWDAENEARKTLFNTLNRARRPIVKRVDAAGNVTERRVLRVKRERQKKLTGREFAIKLAEAGLTPTFMAFLYGTSPDRVMKWIDGIEDIPHPVNVLLEIFKSDPRTIDVAEALTASVTTRMEPPQR